MATPSRDRRASMAESESGRWRRVTSWPDLWLLTLAVVGVAYAPVVRQLVHVWRADPYGGHGLFVPVYTAVLIWIDRQRIAAIPRDREPLGGGVVLVALVLLGVGRSVESIVLQGLSLVIAVAGLVLWEFGPRRFRAALFPIAFLALMLPLPRALVNVITVDVQTFHARLTSVVLGVAGVPHVQSGIYIELPNTTLVVAEGCNGLRFLMALVTLAAAFAQVSQGTLPRKLLLVALTVPLAVIANGLRVSALSLAAHHVGPQAAEGLTHHSIGKTVWVLAGGVLVGLGVWLRRGADRTDGRSRVSS